MYTIFLFMIFENEITNCVRMIDVQIWLTMIIF